MTKDDLKVEWVCLCVRTKSRISSVAARWVDVINVRYTWRGLQLHCVNLIHHSVYANTLCPFLFCVIR